MLAVAVFFHRQQSEVTFFDLRLFVARHRAQHGQAGAFYRFRAHRAVVFGAVTVDDDAANVHFGVVVAEAFGDRRRAFAHRTDVDDEQHGRAEGFRDPRGAADAAAPTVVEPHDALDDRDVGLFGGGEEYLFHRRFAGEPGVEVVGAPARREPQVAGVDVVWADFVGVYAQAACGERRYDAARYRRFAAAALCRGYQQAGTFGAAHFAPSFGAFVRRMISLTM
ncbi:hypothetical protein SDC9_158540 [bioreactor metagenome]|uniref:Uncharacterized protein n=1 Tax=bioreactor metagenome TaxID=1076179 RepID=A0A645FD01_9ZZZZ